jgi:hypothetical protein
MPDLVEQAFDLYLSRIVPPRTQIEAAQRSHNAVRNFLANDDYFGPMIVADFLNGSYARNTVVRPIKDVDVIVVVGPDWLDDVPAEATEALRRKLAQRYPDRRTRRRGRAVRIELCDMDIDVLLAVARDGIDRPLRIPDRNLGRWIETQPKEQLRLSAELQRATERNYCPLIRILKAWSRSRIADADWPGSFVIECAAYHVIAMEPTSFVGRLDDAFAKLLRGLREADFGRGGRWFFRAPAVSDPALPNRNVAERWSESAADGFRAKLDVALRRTNKLDRSRSEDSEVGKWHEIFGDPFPGGATVRRKSK